ncbi:hypothetical protein WA158_005976 [Blastocystis sp. Blastoise]
MNNQIENNKRNEKFVFRFQEENTCEVSSSFLDKYPECILNSLTNVCDDDDISEGIYVDFPVHYPEILVSILSDDVLDIIDTSKIDIKQLELDFQILFPNERQNGHSLATKICQPIFDYCSKSKDIICCCEKPIYSNDSLCESDNNILVEKMNFDDKYVYIINDEYTDLNFDLTTILTDKYLTIFNPSTTFHIQFICKKKKNADIHQVSFNYKEQNNKNNKTFTVYKMNLYKLYNTAFIHWILNNPYKDTIEEVLYGELDNLTQYLSIFKNNLYPHIKNIYFSEYFIPKKSASTYKNLFKTIYSPTVECISFEGVYIDDYISQRIDMIISFINKTCFPNMKKISFQSATFDKNSFFLSGDNTDIFTEINLLTIPKCIPFPYLSALQLLLTKGLTIPAHSLTIICSDYERIIEENDPNNQLINIDIQWKSLYPLFQKISVELQQLTLKYTPNNDFEDMIPLFSSLKFTNLKELCVEYSGCIHLCSSLFSFLSTSSYPSLQTLKIKAIKLHCPHSQSDQTTKNHSIKFEELENHPMTLNAPLLKNIILFKSYFSQELLHFCLLQLLKNNLSIRHLDFQECNFDKECSTTFYTAANEFLFANIEHLEFYYPSVFGLGWHSYLLRDFSILKNNQLASLKKLYYIYSSLSYEAFTSYIDLYTQHIIPSTELSLQDHREEKQSSYMCVPSEDIQLSVDNFLQLCTYLSTEYLPHLLHLYLSVGSDYGTTYPLDEEMKSVQLVRTKQLSYWIYHCFKIYKNDYLCISHPLNSKELLSSSSNHTYNDKKIINNKRNINDENNNDNEIKKNNNEDPFYVDLNIIRRRRNEHK